MVLRDGSGVIDAGRYVVCDIQTYLNVFSTNKNIKYIYRLYIFCESVKHIMCVYRRKSLKTTLLLGEYTLIARFVDFKTCILWIKYRTRN